MMTTKEGVTMKDVVVKVKEMAGKGTVMKDVRVKMKDVMVKDAVVKVKDTTALKVQ